METSKRAVDAYKRTRLVDLVITDDDKVAPMYRLDEIAEMLRTSTSDLIHEVVEYTMKRLGSKSPRVKQKVSFSSIVCKFLFIHRDTYN